MIRGSRLVLVTAALALGACVPEITAILPDSGPRTGGNAIVLSGSDLDTPGFVASVDGVSAIVVEQTSDSARVIVPESSRVGAVEVTVANDEGPGTTSASYTYTRLDGDIDVLITLESGEIDSAFIARQTAAGELSKQDFDARSAEYERVKKPVRQAVRNAGGVIAREFPSLPVLQAILPSEAAMAAIGRRPDVQIADRERQDGTLDTRESKPLINSDLVRRVPLPGNPDRTGAGTFVVVIDSGVDYGKPDFGSCSAPGGGCRVALSMDMTDDDGERDDVGHGTNVAGIVAAIAPGTKIIDIDILRPAPRLGIKEGELLAALDWVIQQKVDGTYNIAAINMSLGFPRTETKNPCFGPFGRAAFNARQAGIVTVVSMGNEGYDDKTKVPGCAPNVVRVGAVHDDGVNKDKETDFSNAWKHLYMVAPGSMITAGGDTKEGTSQAAPHVAAGAALMRAAWPSMSAKDIADRLMFTGIPLDKPKGDFPAQRLDLYAALEGDTLYPKPRPVGEEWWLTARANGGGALKPVFDHPDLKKSGSVVIDGATALRWEITGTANSIQKKVDIRTAYNHCNRTRNGMHLPTRTELLSLVDYQKTGVLIDQARLGKTEPAEYWTMTPSPSGHQIVYTVDFSSGRSESRSAYHTNRTAYLRCVTAFNRDRKAPDPRFTYTSGEPAATDDATGLRWTRIAVTKSDAAEAADHCSMVTSDGRRWRLPSLKEAVSLLAY